MAERGIGFVGDITSIQPRLIETLVEGGYIPVVASVAADYDGQALNVNADIAAGEVIVSVHRSSFQLMHFQLSNVIVQLL